MDHFPTCLTETSVLNGCFVKRSIGTQRRLLDAAAALFSEQGFRATTLRDIAKRGGVNLAAAHYHYGSKRDLYIEVLREQFAEVRNEIEKRNADASPARLARATRRELVELLRNRTEAMLQVMVGPPPSLHSTLMVREMVDPTEAMPVIVREFIEPLQGELMALLKRLAPKLSASGIERCAFSIMGQAFYYRVGMPALLQMKGRAAYPPDFVPTLAQHITEFSLAGLLAVARSGSRRR